ncbi:hypothetical protein SIK69_07990, partial [Scandinavium sp. V105_6]|nr:hypothetical protein [Scandinavium sp. V105_6]
MVPQRLRHPSQRVGDPGHPPCRIVFVNRTTAFAVDIGGPAVAFVIDKTVTEIAAFPLNGGHPAR